MEARGSGATGSWHTANDDRRQGVGEAEKRGRHGTLAWSPVVGYTTSVMQAEYVALLVSTLLWGTSGPVVKLVLPQFGAVEFGLWRSILAGAVMLAIALGRRPALPGRDAIAPLLFLGLLGQFPSALLWLLALERTPAGIVGVISNTSPVFITLGSALLLGEPLSRRALLGTAISCVGVWTIITRGSLVAFGNLQATGSLFAIGGAFAWAFFTLAGRRFVRKFDPALLSALSMFVSTLAFLSAAALAQRPVGLPADPTALIWLLYLGLLPTGVGNTIWYLCLPRLPIAKVAMFQYFTPIWAVLFARVLLGEPLTWSLLVGTAFVLLGVRLVQRG